MGRFLGLRALLGLLALALAGCAPTGLSSSLGVADLPVAPLPTANPTVTPLPPLALPTWTPTVITGPMAALVTHLRAAGTTVERGGRPAPALFANAADVCVLRVGETQVEAYAFGNEEQAIKSTRLVSRSARIVAGREIEWDAPPRFYRWGSFIVLYVGASQSVNALLDAALGTPFVAGQG